MHYAKVRCADTLENRQLQSSARLTSALLFLCVQEARRQKEQISELQVEKRSAKDVAADKRQRKDRSVLPHPLHTSVIP